MNAYAQRRSTFFRNMTMWRIGYQLITCIATRWRRTRHTFSFHENKPAVVHRQRTTTSVFRHWYFIYMTSSMCTISVVQHRCRRLDFLHYRVCSKISRSQIHFEDISEPPCESCDVFGFEAFRVARVDQCTYVSSIPYVTASLETRVRIHRPTSLRQFGQQWIDDWKSEIDKFSK
jgi:hypothetical protein